MELADWEDKLDGICPTGVPVDESEKICRSFSWTSLTALSPVLAQGGSECLLTCSADLTVTAGCSPVDRSTRRPCIRLALVEDDTLPKARENPRQLCWAFLSPDRCSFRFIKSVVILYLCLYLPGAARCRYNLH